MTNEPTEHVNRPDEPKPEPEPTEHVNRPDESKPDVAAEPVPGSYIDPSEVAQRDGEDISADELAGEETEPEHDANPSSFQEVTDDDDEPANG